MKRFVELSKMLTLCRVSGEVNDKEDAGDYVDVEFITNTKKSFELIILSGHFPLIFSLLNPRP